MNIQLNTLNSINSTFKRALNRFKRVLNSFKEKAINEKIEHELSYVLLPFSLYLFLNQKFENIFNSLGNNKTVLGIEFNSIFEKIKNGCLIEDSLVQSSKKFSSLEYKKFISLLIGIYKSGDNENGSTMIRNIALSLLKKQKSRLKEFEGKISMLLIILIIGSIVLPIFLETALVMSYLFLQSSLTQIQIFIIITIGFPLISILSLIFIWFNTPVELKENYF